MKWRSVVSAPLLAAFLATPTLLHAAETVSEIVPGVLPEEWIRGGPNCVEFPEDFQIHEYNENFFILRQNGCVHYEKPFLFLIFGRSKVLLLDTGAGDDPNTGRNPDVYGAVRFVINNWLARNNLSSIHLVVTHLHSHPDHVWGDPQFVGKPNTTLVPPGDVAALKRFFGISNWPEQIVPYDLGGRTVDIIPIPGHDDSHIAVYDRPTGVLLVGDHLYPGRIYINSSHSDFAESTRRMVDFTRNKIVTHVLGTHIERKSPYVDNPPFTNFHPKEVPLELGRSTLLEMLEATGRRTSDGKIVQRAYREFTMCGAFPTCNPVNQ